MPGTDQFRPLSFLNAAVGEEIGMGRGNKHFRVESYPVDIDLPRLTRRWQMNVSYDPSERLHFATFLTNEKDPHNPGLSG
jgi:hypothetical protein